jgi:hypothetical protein
MEDFTHTNAEIASSWIPFLGEAATANRRVNLGIHIASLMLIKS